MDPSALASDLSGRPRDRAQLAVVAATVTAGFGLSGRVVDLPFLDAHDNQPQRLLPDAWLVEHHDGYLARLARPVVRQVWLNDDASRPPSLLDGWTVGRGACERTYERRTKRTQNHDLLFYIPH